MLGRWKKPTHARYDAHGDHTCHSRAPAHRVLQVKTTETDGYSAVQLGFGSQSSSGSPRQLGHSKFGALSADDARKSREMETTATYAAQRIVNFAVLQEVEDRRPARAGTV
jgi:ribosomal protein L3